MASISALVAEHDKEAEHRFKSFVNSCQIHNEENIGLLEMVLKEDQSSFQKWDQDQQDLETRVQISTTKMSESMQLHSKVRWDFYNYTIRLII